MKNTPRENSLIPEPEGSPAAHSLPIRVFGIDSNGRDFSEETETMSVDRHGACFRLRNPVIVGDVVCVRNLRSHQEAQFRVAGCLGSRGDSPDTRAWAVEPVDAPPSFWGIAFPAASGAGQGANQQGMQCCACCQGEMVETTPWHREILRSSGHILRACSRCHQETLWKPAAIKARPGAGDGVGGAEEAPRGERRKRKRAAVRVKVRVRLPYSAHPEVTFSRNLSPDGLAIISARDYPVGTELRIIAPFLQDDFHAEVPARVVHQSLVAGTPSKLYGIRFLKPLRKP